MRSVENTECRKCGVWKMRSVENAECITHLMLDESQKEMLKEHGLIVNIVN